MKFYLAWAGVFCLSVVTLLTLVLGGCAPRDKKLDATPVAGPAAPPGPLAVTPEVSDGISKGLSNADTASALKAATCEQKIRADMEAKKILLESAPGFAAEIAAANATLAQPSTPVYKVSETKNEIQSISIEHRLTSAQGPSGVAYSLSVGKPKGASPYFVEVIFSTKGEENTETIQQKFKVSSVCVLTLSSSERRSLSGHADHYDYKATSHFSDGKVETKTAQFEMPKGAKLYNLLSYFEGFVPQAETTRYFEMDTGLVTLRFEEQKPLSLSKFGLELSFEIKKATIVGEPNLSLSFLTGQQKELGFSFYEVLGMRAWQLPKSVWTKQVLGKFKAAGLDVSSKLPKDYLDSSDSLMLQTAEEISYDHFSAYWKMGEVSLDPKTLLYSIPMQESPTATARGESTAEDLISNETIQTDLPEIQTAKNQILAKAPVDRKEQLRLVLKYLSENYKYDHEMAKNNEILRLSTKEALERGQGVCQHYAVIFTALARALKIPTRIVVGLALFENNQVSHAWVESEVEPGLWQFIDPQGINALAEPHVRYYIPLIRGRFLENKSASPLEFATKITATRMVLLPAKN